MEKRHAVERLVVAFGTTADAMAAEQLLSNLNRNKTGCGKLVPVPRTVSAGCGMAWKDELELKEVIQKKLSAANIFPEQYGSAEFYEKN